MLLLKVPDFLCVDLRYSGNLCDYGGKYNQNLILKVSNIIMDVMERIDNAVKENDVIVFMKGTPKLPQCGFSSRTAQVLMSYGKPFAYINVIEDPEIFQNLPRYQDWPTFPQIYIKGELIGGHDIAMEMHENGTLKTAIEEAVGDAKA